MRAASGLLVLALLTVIGIVALADATKFKGEVEDRGTTRVVFEVEIKKYRQSVDHAAGALWYSCIGSVSWLESTAPQRLGGNLFEATLGPALGEDFRRRFRGCLEDATIDKVRASVQRMETILP